MRDLNSEEMQHVYGAGNTTSVTPAGNNGHHGHSKSKSRSRSKSHSHRHHHSKSHSRSHGGHHGH